MKKNLNKVWEAAVTTPKKVVDTTRKVGKKVVDSYAGRLGEARKGKQDKIRKHVLDLKSKGMLPADSYNDPKSWR
jgi:hypothetical protein